MTLQAGVEFGGDNLSEKLNRRYDLLPTGIYHSFKVRKVPGQAQIQIHKGSHPSPWLWPIGGLPTHL